MRRQRNRPVYKNGRRIYTDEERNELWEAYWQDPSSREIFSKLSESYIDLVETIAYSKKSKLPNHVEADELIAAGFEGLADAIAKFELKGFKFETYATVRINGAIIDHLRSSDKVSRHFRQAFTELDEATKDFIEYNRRQPSNAELAEMLSWDEDKLSRVMGMYISHGEVSLDSVMEDINSSFAHSTPPSGYVQDETLIDPIETFHYEELEREFALVLSQLKENEIKVFLSRVIEGKGFEEIALELEVATSRANAVYQQVVSKLIDQLEI